jgi:hypothetical protein
LFTRTLSSGRSDRIDIDSLVQTVMCTTRVSRPPGKWWVAPTTNTDTPIPDFKNPVIDTDEDFLNISQNILDDEKLILYRQAMSGPNADLWHSAIEAEMYALRRNHTWDWVDISTNRNVVDSKLVFKIGYLSNGSILKLKVCVVVKTFS